LVKKIQIEQNSHIMRIHSDHGKEFENARFEEYCLSNGIQQEFSSPITPQQNGVVEQKKSVTGNGSSNDSLSKSCSTFLGRSDQYCMSYHQ
jgi:transposase InsO family protein